MQRFIATLLFAFSGIYPATAADPELGPRPREAAEVYVVAKQWLWKFQHENGVREIDEVHVPAGQATKFVVISEDVIHCLHFPDFRVKVDALPGKYTTLCVTPEKPGRYPFACCEFCGVWHNKHRGTLVVMKPNEFDAWSKGDKPKADGPPDLKRAGRQLFLKLQCAVCHSGTRDARGPDLAGLFGKEIPLKDGSKLKVDEEYIRESIRRPRAKVHLGWEPIMPPYTRDQASDEEISKLVEFIKSLQPGENPIRAETAVPPTGK